MHAWADLIGTVKFGSILGDLCITPPFARLLLQAQISILEILDVFLRLKFSPSLYLDKIGRSSKVSLDICRLLCNVFQKQKQTRPTFLVGPEGNIEKA